MQLWLLFRKELWSPQLVTLRATRSFRTLECVDKLTGQIILAFGFRFYGKRLILS